MCKIGIVDYLDLEKAKASNVDISHLELGRTVVCVDPRYFRPTEVDLLLGDPTKAKNELGWKPKTTFDQLVEEMCNHE